MLATLLTVLALMAPAASLPDIEDEVMCVQCGTALNVSQAPSADAERRFIKRRIAEGKSKEEIKREMVAEYGPNVLATPRSKATWLVPLLLALLAAAAIAVSVRRWRRDEPDDETHEPREPRTPALEPGDQARLERDMAAYDA